MKGVALVCPYLLQRCPNFRGWYVHSSMELGPEDVSILAETDSLELLSPCRY